MLNKSPQGQFGSPAAMRANFTFCGKKYFVFAAVLFFAAACSQKDTIVNYPVENRQPVFDGRIQIDSPKEAEEIDSNFTVIGKAQDWFEGNISVSVFDTKGNKLYQNSFVVGDNYGHQAQFSKKIALTKKPVVASGWIEFTDYSAKDGSVIYKRVVNIKFKNYGPDNQSDLPLKYDNKQYGFIFSLPADWKGYKVIIQNSGGWSWEASKSPDDSTMVAKGPAIIIRSPLWTASKPYQDIPIEIFTIQQWQDIQSEKIWYRTAAPIGPSELGRNNKYVFALPARYNFAEADGVREVDDIMQNHPLAAY